MGGGDRTGVRDERAQFDAGAGTTLVTVSPDTGDEPGGAAFRPSAAARAGAGDRVRRLASAVGRDFAVEWAGGGAFLCLPVLLGIGALAYFGLGREPSLHAILTGMAVCAAGMLLARARLVAFLLFAAFFMVALGIGAGKLETWRAGTRMMGSDVATRVTGRVVEVEPRADGRVRVTLDVVATRSPTLRYAPQRIRATARAVPAGLAPGEGIEGLVFLMAPSGPVRPGGYDFSFQSYFEGNGAVGFFMGDPARVDLAAAPTAAESFRAGIAHLRQRLAAHVRATIGGAEGAMAAALITGVRGGIPEEVEEALRAAGLAHILAISGLHMALVAFTIMGGIRAVLALFPGFASRHAVRKYAASVALVACGGYLLMSGAEVAARRSFIMLSIMLVAVLFDRSAITMRNLAIAAIVVLAVSPHEVVGPSFQMSFAATAALIAGYAAWNEWRARRPEPDPSRADGILGMALRAVFTYGGGLAMTSMIAGLATAIFAVWHFQRMAPLGLIGNLAAMPFVSAIVMPSAVLAMALLPLGLDGPALWLMGKGVAAVIAIAQWVAAHSPVDGTGLIPPGSVICLSVALVVATVATTRIRLVALPFLLAGILLIVMRDIPDALVSEDGAIVAMRDAEGDVYANVERADDFIMGNWLRALGTSTFAAPVEEETMPDRLPHAEGAPAGFSCTDTVCTARLAGDAMLVSAKTPDAARRFCGTADLIVLDDAMDRDTCALSRTRVLTTRELARLGSVAVWFDAQTNGEAAARLAHAITMPWRPWHTQRAYSRAARGLPPYQSKD